MRPILRLRLLLPLLAVAVLAAMPAAARAQRITAFSLGGGALLHDLGEDGSTAALVLRVEVPYSSAIMIEPGIMVARPELDSGNEWLLLPQTLVQLRIPAGSGVEPYVGAGAGLALGFESVTGSDVDVLFTVATGIRIDYGGLLGFVLDARAHAVGFDADARMLELTLGLRVRR